MNITKKQLYNAIMEQVSLHVRKALLESMELNERNLEDTKKDVTSTVYFCLNNFVDYDAMVKRNKAKAFNGELTKIEKKILEYYSDKDETHAKEIMQFLKKRPELVDELFNKNSYFYFANVYKMKPLNIDINKYIKKFKQWIQVNDSEEAEKLAADRKENKDYSDDLFKNDFDEKNVNYGIPKNQDCKKYAFAAYQNHVKYMTDAERKQSDKIARDLGYSSWNDAFVNYGLNLDGFVLKYVQGEEGGGKRAEERSKKNWNYNKYAFTTRFAEQWVFGENFDPEQFMKDCCKVRIDNSYIENCKFVA